MGPYAGPAQLGANALNVTLSLQIRVAKLTEGVGNHTPLKKFGITGERPSNRLEYLALRRRRSPTPEDLPQRGSTLALPQHPPTRTGEWGGTVVLRPLSERIRKLSRGDLSEMIPQTGAPFNC